MPLSQPFAPIQYHTSPNSFLHHTRVTVLTLCFCLTTMALWAASPPRRRRPLGPIKLGALNNNGIMECIAAREGDPNSPLLIFHIDRVNRGIGISTVRCGRQRYVHYPYQLRRLRFGKAGLTGAGR
ncbi:hypothetical protein FOZ60_006817 [Perkinsus olseni]|uniref:Uncharacterized protein n=1 Tax=Perkinsus olseni TaxID=32597 RepID=A0A7J6NQ39_PEROL|nr:hypothetical protein FOZ60_006817 [Perkinsus olseni]